MANSISCNPALAGRGPNAPRDGSVVSFLHCMNDPQPEGHMASDIERRKFLATLGGAAVAWPLAARAQQPAKTPRVGYIRAGTPNNDQVREEFVRGMRDLGYVEGRNITYEFRYYGDDIESIPSLINDLLRKKVDVIVAGGAPAIRARRRHHRVSPSSWETCTIRWASD